MSQSSNIYFPNYKSWKLWFNHLKLDFKIFNLSILLFPVVNFLWGIKVPVFSMSVTALFNAIFIIYFLIVIIQKRKYLKSKNLHSKLMYTFCFLFYLKSIFVFLFGINGIEFALSSIIFSTIYLTCTRLIQSELDFLMVFKTYIYSQLILISSYITGIPGSNERITRGLDRNTLGYYDVTNAGFQSIFVIILVLFLYNYCLENKIRINRQFHIENTFIIIFSLLIIKDTYHVLTYVCLAVVFFYYLIFSSKKFLAFGFVILISLGIIITGYDVLLKFYNIIFYSARTVVIGDVPTTAFAGRVGIWISFYDSLSLYNNFQLFTGYYKTIFATSFAHNDFIRIFSSVGLLGLIIYVFALIAFILSTFRKKFVAIKILSLSVFTVIILYSLTTVPTAATFSSLPISLCLIYISKK